MKNQPRVGHQPYDLHPTLFSEQGTVASGPGQSLTDPGQSMVAFGFGGTKAFSSPYLCLVLPRSPSSLVCPRLSTSPSPLLQPTPHPRSSYRSLPGWYRICGRHPRGLLWGGGVSLPLGCFSLPGEGIPRYLEACYGARALTHAAETGGVGEKEGESSNRTHMC